MSMSQLNEALLASQLAQTPGADHTLVSARNELKALVGNKFKDNGSFQRQQSRSRQNNSGSGFFVENLTSADLAEIKFFSSILDRAAATGKLTRISPSATDTAQTTTSCKHGCGDTNGSSDATGDGAAGGTGLPPTFRSQLSSNTTSSLKAKRNSTVQPIPPPFPRSGPGSDLRQQHFHHKHKNHDASFAPAVSNGAPYSKWDCASYRLPSAKSILPGAISGAPSSNIMKDVPGYVRAPAGLLSADPGPVDANPMKKPRCFVCGKKTRIGATYSCRCEGVFCAQHRYAESHDCTFDYKSEGKKLLEYTNPVVTAPKLPKI
ncbi:uncharacterized protein LOC142334936 [Convolutriloba macropyga]|uniref:uncharacterized protein LOC142334936 n=1 Tax=Convolutriloba macropyga TaxID=536237 RepID=UPI003F522700